MTPARWPRGPRPIPAKYRFLQKVKITPSVGCWEWVGSSDRYGRGQMVIGSKYDGSRRLVLATRLGWELYNGPIQAGLSVLHKCDNPNCVRPSHLFLGTQADNIRDMRKKNRLTRKLTDEQVVAIRSNPTTTATAFAAEFGVSVSAVSRVRRNKVWNDDHLMKGVKE